MPFLRRFAVTVCACAANELPDDTVLSMTTKENIISNARTAVVIRVAQTGRKASGRPERSEIFNLIISPFYSEGGNFPMSRQRDAPRFDKKRKITQVSF